MVSRALPGFQGDLAAWARRLATSLAPLANSDALGRFLIEQFDAQTWEPTITCAAGTFAGAPAMAVFAKLGKARIFALHYVGTTAGGPGNIIYFTLPDRAKPATASFPLYVNILDTVDVGGCGKILSTQNRAQVKRYDASNFGVGAVEILVAGIYEALE